MMRKNSSTIHRFSLLLIMILPLMVAAETVYIDEKVLIGLHLDKDIDSPIVKLLPGGTVLEVISSGAAYSQVKEPDGASGWIDNKYLIDKPPGSVLARQAQETIAKLQSELAAAKKGKDTTTATTADAKTLARLNQQVEELKQQVQSEQLKVGQYQAEAAELRSQLSRTETDAGANSPSSAPGTGSGISVWRAILIGLVCIVIGLLAGAWLMDWNTRRRHGGFRI